MIKCGQLFWIQLRTMLDPKPTHLKETGLGTLQIHTTEHTVDSTNGQT